MSIVGTNRMLSIMVIGWLAAFTIALPRADAQELGGAGTLQGTIKDPTGGVMVSVTVNLSNAVTGLKRSTATDAMGKYVFRNLPPNPYHVQVEAQGFQTLDRDVDVRSAVPIQLDLMLALATATENVQVVGHTDLLEADPSAHTDIDQSLIEKLPLQATSGLNQVVMLGSPGVVADSNGFFHPIGDHAQTQFSIDNQPITDQQSRVYSNQISQDAVQSMEIITGVAPAEYGDKSSLVVHIVTKSGLDQPKPVGNVTFGYGSFKTPSVDASLGGGSPRVGNFLSITGLRTDRLLDPPEFDTLHGAGNNISFFDRIDAHASGNATFHLNVQAARSSFDVPNTFDQNDAGQSQHQAIKTFNIAPGYSQVIGAKALFTVNAFVRQDRVIYSPSADPFADTPATISQERHLTNFGVKADMSYVTGPHNVKFGGTVAATRLNENFSVGFTDPAFNSPESPDFNPDLAAFDLTRGGALFSFAGKGTIKQQAFFIQDNIKAGHATFMVGLRVDHYDGQVTATQAEPRLGVSFAVPGSNTVLRASYGRTMETPYNENLLLSSGFGAEALVGQGQALQPGKRNQVEIGIQQALGRWVVFDFGYFNKRTTNAYDFGVLFNTPIAFPISWDHSKIDGFSGRINLVEHGGFSAFVVMAHTNAIFSPPGNGGVLVEEGRGDFRIDHDQKFNSTTNLQYVFHKASGAWAALSWRYDSGLVAGAVPDYASALALAGDDQAAIGLFCGSTFATRDAPLTGCASANRGATRLVIPADGTEDDVNNPPRIAPRHLLDLGLGVDNLFHASGGVKVKLRFSVLNLTNRIALYNFHSTFSGTHFVTPRAYQIQVGVNF